MHAFGSFVRVANTALMDMASRQNTMGQSVNHFFGDAVPKPARLYILAVIFVGLSLGIHALVQTFIHVSWSWLWLAGLCTLTSCLSIKVTFAQARIGSLTVSVSDFCIFAALLIFGLPVAVVIAMIEGLVSGLKTGVRHLYKYLFNIAQLALVTSVIGSVLQHLQQRPPALGSSQTELIAELALKVLFCSLLYFIFNSTLVAMAVALVTVQSLALVWRADFLWVCPTNLLNTLTAAVAFFSAAPLFYAIALVLVPLIVSSYYSHRIKLAQQPAV